MSSGLDLWITLQAQTLLLLQIFMQSLCSGRGISPNMLSLSFKTFFYRLSGSYCPFSSPLWDVGMTEQIEVSVCQVLGTLLQAITVVFPRKTYNIFSCMGKTFRYCTILIILFGLFVSLYFSNSSFPLVSVLNLSGSLHPVFY